MSTVLILIDSLTGTLSWQTKATLALKQAIATHPPNNTPPTVQVLTTAEELPDTESETIFCPLTLDLDEGIDFPGRSVFQSCQNIQEMRQRVSDTFGVPSAEGEYWLPIVLTAKGPLYAEAIAYNKTSQNYIQPLHLSDRQRQPLYRLAARLLKLLAAPPAVYLLQFGYSEERLVFDRLLPFPAAPAIASIGVQSPDLFTAHWLCLTGQPLLDLSIEGSVSPPFLMIDTSPSPK